MFVRAILSLLLCSVVTATSSSHFIRGNVDFSRKHISFNDTNTSIVLKHNDRTIQQRLMQDDGMKDFSTLSCNTNLNSATCQTWTSKFGTATSYSNLFIIPCGECITMDVNLGGSVSFLNGIDIQGKLVIPNGVPIHITATMIIVQGELEMASTKPVNGIPNIKITMIGQNDKQTFTPIDSNANACNFGEATCVAGKKAIIVAGGKVNIHGLPSNTKTWTRLYDAVGANNNLPDTIYIERTNIDGKWTVGAEILFTSHTRLYNDAQVRSITSISNAPVANYLAIKLNSPILRPTTIIESADFATEVALLSRNILLEGGADTTSRHGGHFMIMHTPTIVQVIEGMEVTNFGQQGTLGKYPIHFHYCKDVPGSIVSKNTIRQSNQRCVVVHGTNQLRIEENVAFDTKGHCYILEDGIETGNEFVRNLGAQTGKPITIIPNSGANGDESDDQPSTFWITNPTNTFIGNVAAGSDESGFWFDPKVRGTRAYLFPPPYDPQAALITLFKDNVAHSCVGKLGAIRTYTPGYRPSAIVTFDGIKAYRNIMHGIHLHRSQNIIVANSLVADNINGIDIDRAQGIEVINTTVIGESESYRQLQQRQPEVGNICLRNLRAGIDLHTWKTDQEWSGAKISNVKISGFERTTCSSAASMKYDTHTLKQGLFEFYTTFREMDLVDGPSSIDFCIVNQDEFSMAYVIDLDGSMNPNPGSTTQVISTLVATDDGRLLELVDTSKCDTMDVGCYSYCTDTCFRSMRYEITGSGQENYSLKVCLKGDANQCTTFPGGRRGDEGSHTFIAHLPTGKTYDAVFLNNNGREVEPDTIVVTEEESFCPTDSIFDITLVAGGLTGSDLDPPTFGGLFSRMFNWLLNLIFKNRE